MYLCDVFLKAEHAWIEFEEDEDVFEGILFWVL